MLASKVKGEFKKSYFLVSNYKKIGFNIILWKIIEETLGNNQNIIAAQIKKLFTIAKYNKRIKPLIKKIGYIIFILKYVFKIRLGWII